MNLIGSRITGQGWINETTDVTMFRYGGGCRTWYQSRWETVKVAASTGGSWPVLIRRTSALGDADADAGWVWRWPSSRLSPVPPSAPAVNGRRLSLPQRLHCALSPYWNSITLSSLLIRNQRNRERHRERTKNFIQRSHASWRGSGLNSAPTPCSNLPRETLRWWTPTKIEKSLRADNRTEKKRRGNVFHLIYCPPSQCDQRDLNRFPVAFRHQINFTGRLDGCSYSSHLLMAVGASTLPQDHAKFHQLLNLIYLQSSHTFCVRNTNIYLQ